MYALGSEGRSSTVTLGLSYDDPFIMGKSDWAVTISTEVVAYQTWEDEDFTPTKGREYEIAVGVGDAYNDAAEGRTNGGYSLSFRPDASDINDETTIAGLYLIEGILYTDATGTTLPKVLFTNTAQTNSSFRVTSPLSGRQSGWVPFDHVIKSLDVEYRVPSEDGTTTTDTATVEEGSTLSGQIVNLPYSQGPLYAFLVANEEPNAVDCNWFTNSSWVVGTNYTNGAGLRIPASATSTEMTVTPVTPFQQKIL